MSAEVDILSTNPLVQLAITGSIVGVIGFIITQIRDFNRKTKQMEERLNRISKEPINNNILTGISLPLSEENLENLRNMQRNVEAFLNSRTVPEKEKYIETKDLTPLSEQLEKLSKKK